MGEHHDRELVDHHCHGLILEPMDRLTFEGLLNEASGPSSRGGSFFDSMLGVAIRRWCAPVLGLEPDAAPDAYLERRTALGIEASRRLVLAAGISTYLVDTGPRDTRLGSRAELVELAGGTAYEVLRLETLAEDLLGSGTAPAQIPAALAASLSTTEAIAAKTVAAYRSGLDLPDHPPPERDVVARLDRVARRGDHHRIEDRLISGWLAWTALRAGLPLQVHVGLGDADLDLRSADPLCLTPFLRASESLDVPIVLLHCYPFHRSAAYLSQVYGHVFCDLGLSVHSTGALSRSVIRETLELVPFGKLLFATDAYGLAELYHLGAWLFRRGLASVLDELTGSDELSEADAGRLQAMIFGSNARRVYALP